MIYIELTGYLVLMLVMAGSIYSVIAIISVVGFFGQRSNITGQNVPASVPVSILKPLKGSDPELKKNILSFCDQDYETFEVLLGLNMPDEKEMAEIRSIVESLAGRNIRVIVGDKDMGANRKVSNLQALFEATRNPLIVFSDSDMRVDRDYLKTITSEYLGEDNVGMVTCLYKITDPKSPGAAFESLSIALDFLPSVLVARRLEGVSFGLGASMLLSGKGLEKIGGLKRVADYLADDYQIGNRLWKLGYRIIISRYVVENVAGPMTFSEYFMHQLRWARTIEFSRPGGFAGIGITHIWPFALILALLWGFNGASLSVLAAVFMLRLLTAAVVYRTVIKKAAWLKWLPILPLKDVISFIIWLGGLLGSRVRWRGAQYRIKSRGKIAEI